jgi:succinyl-CoA synthetase alpha subunit
MSILVDQNSRVVVQGITGAAGTFHTRQCVAYGTHVVAGVTPFRGGTAFDAESQNSTRVEIPIFDTMAEAVKQTAANVSLIFVPPPGAADAILEAADSGIALIVCITEGIPVLDMVRAKSILQNDSSKLIGPNCPGIISPGQCKVGIMPGAIHLPGKVGVISRSGTLTYEAVGQLTHLGIGQSTCIGIGGDPVGGLDFVDALKLFNEDPDTDAILLIGEIGGNAEQRAADYITHNVQKPVAAFIAGTMAPPGKRMGHAGAIISGSAGTASDKIAALESAGVRVAKTPADMGAVVKSLV